MTGKTELEVTQADREPDMSWFLFAVRKGGRDVVILDYAPGWEPHNIEFHWEDTFQDDPPSHLEPGSYLWTGFTVAYWGDDDHLKVTGGNFAALTAATRTPDPTPVAWMPIESAPKDGSAILLYFPHRDLVIRGSWDWQGEGDWESGTQDWCDWNTDDDVVLQEDPTYAPTRWMPLPPTPNHIENTRDMAPSAVPADGLVDMVARMNRFVEGFAKSLEMADFDNVEGALAERMCCNGQMCGCQGASVGGYLAHELRTAAIAAYRGEA